MGTERKTGMTVKTVPEGGAKVFASGSSGCGDTFRSGGDKTPEVITRTGQDQTTGMNTEGKKKPQPNTLKKLPGGGDTFST